MTPPRTHLAGSPPTAPRLVASWVVLAFALASVAVQVAPAAGAQGSPGADVAAWPWTTPGLRGGDHLLEERVALERCALASDPATPSVACVRVLAALAVDREELHRALRAVVRVGSATSVREAAAALALMPEVQSGDLYLWALLRERGGPLAAPLLLEAWEGGDPPWLGAYLRYLAAFAPDPLTRGVVAGRILRQRQVEVERVLPLLQQVKDTLAGLAALSADDPRQALAPELEAAIAHIRRACDLEGSRALRCPWWRAPPSPPNWARWPPATCAPSRAAFGPVGDYTAAAALACADEPDPRAFHQAMRLAQRFPRRKRPPIETLLIGQEGHRAATPYRLVGASEEVAPHAEIAELPPGFWGFDPDLPQPAWYPPHVHLTVDDGPRPGALGAALDALAAYEVKATFFFVGSALVRRRLDDAAQLASLVERVVTEGHLIGYHSMHHVVDAEFHESNRGPDQFADSVALFRALLADVVGPGGEEVAVRYGRHAGGRGAYFETMPRDFAGAGLSQHVLWTFGPPQWSERTRLDTIRGFACPLATSPEPAVVLLHEYPRLGDHLHAFLGELRASCPRESGAASPDTRASFPRDAVFAPLRAPAVEPDGPRFGG